MAKNGQDSAFTSKSRNLRAEIPYEKTLKAWKFNTTFKPQKE
jgi:hypothetical protein